jgi:hypothetical protein
LRAPGSLTSGEIEAVFGVGPSAPHAKRGLSGVEYLAQAARASLRGLQIDLVGDLAELVVLLRHAGGAEGIGLDQVGARRQVLLVNRADDIRLREHQQFVVSLHVDRVVGEARAAEVRFLQLVALDHRAHRAVEDQDAATEQVAQARFGVGGNDGIDGGINGSGAMDPGRETRVHRGPSGAGVRF